MKLLRNLAFAGLLALTGCKWAPNLKADNPCDPLYEGPPARCPGDITDVLKDEGKDAGSIQDVRISVRDAFSSSTKPQPYQPDEHCQALFHFDEPFPFKNHCGLDDLINEATESVLSQESFGQARHFNGGSYLHLPPEETTPSKTALTVEALIKPDLNQFSFTGDFGNIITKANSIPQGLEGYLLFVGKNNVLGASLGVKEGEFQQITTTYQLPTDKFTHLAFTYDGSQLKLFIDGKLKKQQSCTGEIHYGGTPLRIGGYGTANSFIGVIDEVRISDVARNFSGENTPELPDAGNRADAGSLDVRVEEVGNDAGFNPGHIFGPYERDEHCTASFHFDEDNYLGNNCGGEYDPGREATSTPTTQLLSAPGFGVARHFNGESVIVYDAYAATESYNITLDALVRPQLSESSFNGDRGWIVNKAACPPPPAECSGYGIYVEQGHKIIFLLGVNHIETKLEVDYPLLTDRFTHLRGTYDGTEAKFFINGRMIDSLTVPGTIFPSWTINIGIGGEPYFFPFAHRFIGVIDEVRISDIAREF